MTPVQIVVALVGGIIAASGPFDNSWVRGSIKLAVGVAIVLAAVNV